MFLDAFWFEKYVIDWNYFDISAAKENKIKIIPDVLLITGDSIDKTEKIDLLDDLLKLIKSSIPKYAITGNWEYWGHVDLSKLR